MIRPVRRVIAAMLALSGAMVTVFGITCVMASYVVMGDGPPSPRIPGR